MVDVRKTAVEAAREALVPRAIDGRVAAGAPGPPYRDAHHLERRADPSGQVGGLLVQQPDDLGADRAAAQERQADRWFS